MRLQRCWKLVLLYVICAAAPAANAQEPVPEFTEVPSSLSSDHLRNTPLYPDRGLLAQPRRTLVSPAVFAGLAQHPRPSLEARAKLAVSGYEHRRKQYLRCELQDGRVLVGTVVYAMDKSFVLRTGVIAEQTIKYSALASEPKPVAGTGQKIVRDAELTGMITVAVVLTPILIPIFLVACISGNCPD